MTSISRNASMRCAATAPPTARKRAPWRGGGPCLLHPPVQEEGRPPKRSADVAGWGTLARRRQRELPPPLWGRVGVGGRAVWHPRSHTARPPPPPPPHKGEGRRKPGCPV